MMKSTSAEKNESLKEYVETISNIEKEKESMLQKPDKDINDIYDSLKKKGSIQCSDSPSKETKIDRILTLKSIPSNNFAYRGVKIDAAFMKTAESDWEFSSKARREIFRTVCLDEKTNDVMLSTDRVEGDSTSVIPNWQLCETSFPGKGRVAIGGMHTHPDFLDKPLESLGDILVFASSDNEMFSCTATRWGSTCMYRMKEPAKIFDIPKIKKGADPSKPEPEIDKDGKIVYDVKSDVVDWNRVMKFANRNLTDPIFMVARGNLTRSLTDALGHLPFFTPKATSKSIGTIEAMSKFGEEKSEPRMVNNMSCESFIDIVGANAKIRTVCDDGGSGKKPFYVESPITPGRLFFFKNKGFPTNFYSGEDVIVNRQFPLAEGQSKFWNKVDKNSPGYHKTRAEMADEVRGIDSERTTIRAGKFTVDGANYCEYLLLPFKEGSDPSGEGKPAGISCRKLPRDGTKETCILT